MQNMTGSRFLLTALLVAVLGCAVTCHVVGDRQTHWEAMKAVSHSNLGFANSLYTVLSKKDGNVFFSPASIHVILGMTSLGARGTTAQEMVETLHLPADHQKTKDGFRQLINSLRANENVKIKIANKIFTDARFPPTEEFVQISKKDFHSGSQLVDFQHNHNEARDTINSWVEDNTEHKIQNLLPPGSLDSSTAIVLVNAIFFNGTWDDTFEPRMTSPKPFHVSPEVTKDVPMMYKYVKGDFAYVDSKVLNADILEIPYVGKTVSMVVILPKEKNGLHDVETRLAGIHLSSITSHEATHPYVRLSLPKFKMEETTDLKKILKQMGMTTMFTSQADLSGLLVGPATVSEVAHKAFIEVTEKGTEAAAATAVVISLISAREDYPPPTEITFKADHPFIFMLVNTETDGLMKERTVLFMGRYSQPN